MSDLDRDRTRRSPRPAARAALVLSCSWSLAVLAAGCGGNESEHGAPARDRECPGPASVGAESGGAESAPEPRVELGTCDASWLPPGTTRDLSNEDAAALASAVRDWLAGRDARVVPARDGIAFAKSEDDRGDDPPYPPEAAAVSARACGLGATWLADHLRARFAMSASPDFDGVTCEENVCCYAGMEFVPHARVVFRRDAERDLWEIESALFVSEAALSEELVERNRREVAAALSRLATQSCAREPFLAR